jgi:hypothetical protein
MRLVFISIFIPSTLSLGAIKPNQITVTEKVVCGLNPHLDKTTCSKYGRIINKYSKLYGIDWKIPVAIFQQESSFIMNATSHTKDYGIGQINIINIKHKNLDKKRLVTDYEYAIHESFKIMKELKEKYDSPHSDWRAWYTRYHSFTPERRKIYGKYLHKRLQLIKKVENEQREAYQEINYAGSSKSPRIIAGREVPAANCRYNGTFQRLCK